jgi:hypothetical protein
VWEEELVKCWLEWGVMCDVRSDELLLLTHHSRNVRIQGQQAGLTFLLFFAMIQNRE